MSLTRGAFTATAPAAVSTVRSSWLKRGRVSIGLARGREPDTVPCHLHDLAVAEVKADYWAIFDLGDDVEPGLDAAQLAQKNIDAFAKRWRDSYPAAVRALLADRESLTVYLRFPREHWNRIRHSNFIERTFGETRRRVKVIGRLPGEHSCLSLVWAVLDRASTGWRGFTMTPAGLRLLADLRRSLHDPPTQLPQPNSASRAETALAPTDSTAVA